MSRGKLIKTTGVVLRSIKLGESDRLITLLSPEKGKISAVAKGARKTKSKLSAAVDLFVYGDYILYQGRNLFTVSQCEIIKSFPHLKNDFAAYSYATYFAEIVQKVIVEEAESEDIFSLFMDTLRLLKGEIDYFLLSRVFELKLLSAVGYYPVFDECIYCGKGDCGFFSTRLGGTVCGSCRFNDEKAFSFSRGTASLVRFMLASPLEKAGMFRAGDGQRKELYRYNRGLLEYHLDISECRSLKYIMEHCEK